MLKHLNEHPSAPARVVVLGASGFLGKALLAKLAERGIATLAPTRSTLDLAERDAASELERILRPDDTLVMLAALTPDRGKDIATLMNNLAMAETVCRALAHKPVRHCIYVSSDAVYPFRGGLVNEQTAAEPADLYAAMHRTRELMFADACGEISLAILRPTLLYGPGDTHNSYGPNRFRRQAAESGAISLGGEGEETRDHLFVEDAAGILCDVIDHRSEGLLNVASGRSVTFMEIARMVAAQFDTPVEVKGSPRNMPVTHRTFDTTALLAAFPRITLTSLDDGLARAHRDVAPDR